MKNTYSFVFANVILMLLLTSSSSAQTRHGSAAGSPEGRPPVHRMSENGGPRGGGDEFVGTRIQPVKRRILGHIQEWVASGTLRLDATQLAHLLALAQDPDETMSQAENLRHLRIYSEEQVQNESWIPPSNGAPGHFRLFPVNAANDPNARPPYLDISQNHWKDLEAEEAQTHLNQVEFFFLHELLSVSKIHDSDFEQSYQVQVQLLNRAAQVKDEYNEWVKKSAELYRKFFQLDLGALNSSLLTMMASSDYHACFNKPENESAHAEEKRVMKYCNPIVDVFQTNEGTFIRDYVKTPGEKLNADLGQLTRGADVWLQSLPSAWQDPYHSNFQNFLDKLNPMAAEYNQRANEFVDALPTTCPFQLDLSRQFACLFGKPVTPNASTVSEFPAAGTYIQQYETGLAESNLDRIRRIGEAERAALH